MLFNRKTPSVYTSVDIDYERISVAVTTRAKHGVIVRAATKNLAEQRSTALPENEQGSTLSAEATALISEALRELFTELDAPLKQVGVNSPDRNTTLSMFTSPNLKPKDFHAAARQHATSLLPDETNLKASPHVLHKTSNEVTALISIINSPYAEALADALRGADAFVDLMQPRIISIVNAMTALAPEVQHPTLVAHITRNATSLAVLRPPRNNSKQLQFARIMPLGAEQALEQPERFSRELRDTIAEYRTNQHAPANIIITGRHHDHPVILNAAEEASLHVQDLTLYDVRNETPDVSMDKLPALIGLALTRISP